MNNGAEARPRTPSLPRAALRDVAQRFHRTATNLFTAKPMHSDDARLLGPAHFDFASRATPSTTALPALPASAIAARRNDIQSANSNVGDYQVANGRSSFVTYASFASESDSDSASVWGSANDTFASSVPGSSSPLLNASSLSFSNPSHAPSTNAAALELNSPVSAPSRADAVVDTLGPAAFPENLDNFGLMLPRRPRLPRHNSPTVPFTPTKSLPVPRRAPAKFALDDEFDLKYATPPPSSGPPSATTGDLTRPIVVCELASPLAKTSLRPKSSHLRGTSSDRGCHRA